MVRGMVFLHVGNVYQSKLVLIPVGGIFVFLISLSRTWISWTESGKRRCCVSGAMAVITASFGGCALPVLALHTHVSSSSFVSGEPSCFPVDYRARGALVRHGARRTCRRRRRRRSWVPCRMSVDVDNDQDNVNSKQNSPQEQDERVPVLDSRRGR